ncbi:MAG: hypothetical protein QM784_24035 [Polyangiaceae bacterium]
MSVVTSSRILGLNAPATTANLESIAGCWKSRQSSREMTPLRAFRGALLGSIIVGALVSWAGCGPSVQFIYEGNIRFEHCYRLDFDPNIAPSHRKACWEDWLQRFPRGQTRDRFEYARRRIDSLAGGERGTLNLNLVEAADAGTDSNSAMQPAPAPTNAHSPPPARMAAPESADVSTGTGGSSSTSAAQSSTGPGGSAARSGTTASVHSGGSSGPRGH